MNAIATPVEALPRSRRRAIAIAAATLWLPCLAPLVFGMLRDSSHALTTFLCCLPLVPGILLPALLQLDGAMFGIVAALPTLLAGVALYAGARELPRPWLHLVQGAVMTAIAFEAVGFAYALRA